MACLPTPYHVGRRIPHDQNRYIRATYGYQIVAERSSNAFYALDSMPTWLVKKCQHVLTNKPSYKDS